MPELTDQRPRSIDAISGAEMRAWRATLKLKQLDMAEGIGVSVRAYRDYEASPSPPLLVRRAFRDFVLERHRDDAIAAIELVLDYLKGG
ncbi:MAG: helix-turn-helix transcriptional regulator [Alphaproteobacteria bacterium]|nr:helix-turn-helix transcriptional regulator [Alphaproteobacteria bacterium]